MIAISIVAKTIDEAISDIHQANALGDAIELNLGFLEEVNETVLEELFAECKKPVIVSNKKKAEAMPEGFNELERFFIFRKAIDFGAAFVEVEFESEKKFLADIKNYKQKTKLIVSYTDDSGTPPRETLESVLKKQIAAGADIIKTVTLARSQKDNEIVLGLIQSARNYNKLMIGFCTGDLGKQSMVDCIAKGAMITFACLEKGKEAFPGELTVKEMRKALKLD